MVLVAALLLGCGRDIQPGGAAAPASRQRTLADGGPDDRAAERRAMVERIADYSPAFRVRDPKVLRAMSVVPRHEFVPPEAAADAYSDQPLPIGEGQTISQPLIVAAMTAALDLQPGDRVLEVGTGSGYQAAVLSLLAAEVYSVEIVGVLAERAAKTLSRLGHANVKVRSGDGYKGWPEAAPFDAVIVTCAPDHVPRPLTDQLKVGGRMIIPVGAELKDSRSVQELVVVRKTAAGLAREKMMDVRFVPMVGEVRRSR
ncbi:MAG: protein-L-isoaspartate(D-aspartate) O-methyltransferase [Elusimicrobia bacterium]|nr:protein-L-isoaspartate(D-aspartate) O-methyltransferase [Elusimicrobiota bacterium]